MAHRDTPSMPQQVRERSTGTQPLDIAAMLRRVLLVEDDPASAELVEVYLQRFASPEVVRAVTVQEAEDAASRHGFDIVILDLGLPDTEGLQAIPRMRRALPDYTPLIVLTGMDEDAFGLDVIQQGADDFISKNDLDAQRLHRAVRYTAERNRGRRAEHALLAATADINVARSIQTAIYPALPPDIPGFDVAARAVPSAEVGGDYYDYLTLNNGHPMLIVGDATGHGLGPAIIMATTAAQCAAFALHRDNPADVLSDTNRLLSRSLPSDRFVSAIAVELQPERGTLRFCNAGHPPAYVIKPDGAVRAALEGKLFPLGVEPDATYRLDGAFTMQPGETLVLYTDGVTERMTRDMEMFGEPRLIEVVQRRAGATADEIVEAVHDAVQSFGAGAPFTDDVTVVVAKRL